MIERGTRDQRRAETTRTPARARANEPRTGSSAGKRVGARDANRGGRGEITARNSTGASGRENRDSWRAREGELLSPGGSVRIAYIEVECVRRGAR